MGNNYLDFLGDFNLADYDPEEEYTPLLPGIYKPAEYPSDYPSPLDLTPAQISFEDDSPLSLEPSQISLLPPAVVDTTSIENKRTPLSFSDSTTELNQTDLESNIPQTASSENMRDFIKKNLTKIEEDIALAKDRAYGDGKKLTKPEIIGRIFTSVLPIIAGAAFRGKQGAGLGADIATAQGLADQKRRAAIDAEQRRAAQAELGDLRTQENILRRADLAYKSPEQLAQEAKLKLQGQIDARVQTEEALKSRGLGTYGRDPSGKITDFDRMTPSQQEAYLANKAGVGADGNPIQEVNKKDRVLVPPPSVIEKIGAADALPVKQERLRDLYNKATKEIKPGFINAYFRKGIGAFPANIQAEFRGTLESLAMELNKAVDPTPSDSGKASQLKALEAAIETGNFLAVLDNKIKQARATALSSMKPYTLGSYANPQAVEMYTDAVRRWGDVSKEESSGGTFSGLNLEALRVEKERRLKEREGR